MQVLSQRKRIFLDFRVQEVYPSLTTLLAISTGAKLVIELRSNSAPLLGAVFSDQLDELLILSFCPVALLYS